jgi:energy-coupling factor transporter transmembrane protein EcfT
MEVEIKNNNNEININETKKLSNKTKKNSQYSKISTTENEDNINDLEIEKENVITTISTDNNEFNINQIIINNTKYTSYIFKRLGNTFSFFADKNGNPLFIIGPHWPMFFCTSFLISLALYLFFRVFWLSLNNFFKISGVLIYIIFITSYTYTFLINPGYPKHDLQSETGEPRNKYRFCGECKMWVNIDKNVNHCFDCNICVEGFDHHCPWTSKCIGKKNLWLFNGFTISLFSHIGYLIFALVSLAVVSDINKKKN